MSFSIILYRFNKRSNSDVRPEIGTNINETDTMTISYVRIKSVSSIVNPVLRLNISNDDIPTYNYCYIPKFKRYYFIGDVVYNAPYWDIYLTIDALATYKENIEKSTQYIDRSSNQAMINSDIIDSIYPTTTTGMSVAVDAMDFNDLVSGWDGGSFVVGVINGQTRANGSVNYYCMTHLEISSMMNYMLGGSTYLNITDVSDDMVKILFDPFQYIVSCYWFPMSRAHMPAATTATTLRFGWWTSSVSTYALDNTGVYTASGSITIPRHPQKTQVVYDPIYGANVSYSLNYLDQSPYSEYVLVYGPFGEIPIDSTLIYGKTNLYIWLTIDCISGLGKLYLAAENDITKAFKIVRANCATDVQLSKIGSSALNNIGQMISGAGQIANQFIDSASGVKDSVINNIRHSDSLLGRGDALLAASGQAEGVAGTSSKFNIGGLINSTVGAVGSMISTSIASKFPAMQSVGSTGSVVEWARVPALQLRYYNITGVDILNKGMPACKRSNLLAYPGYYQINNPIIEIPTATTGEKELIAAHMQNGFYHV